MDSLKSKPAAKPINAKPNNINESSASGGGGGGGGGSSSQSTPIGSPPSRPQSPHSFDNLHMGSLDDSQHRQPASYATMPLPGSHSARPSRRTAEKFAATLSSGRNKIFGLDTTTLKNLAGKSDEPFSDGGPHLTVETAACHDPTLIFGEPKSRTTPPDAVGTASKPASVRSTKKKKKLAINPTSTAADIFAATISDAMVDAEDSEGDEDFVRYHAPKRPAAALPQSYPHQPPLDPAYGDISSPPMSTRPSKSQSGFTPSLRDSNDSSRPPKSSRKVSTGLNNDDIYASTLNQQRLTRGPTYGAANRENPYVSPPLGDYWDSEDERAPLFDKSRQFPFPRQRHSCCRFFVSLTLASGMFALCGLTLTMLLFSTRPLTDVGITQITNVLAARRELIFDVDVRGRNWNLFAVSVRDGDLGVFAQSKNITTGAEMVFADPAEFLGPIYRLDEPLRFPSASFPTAKTGRVSTSSTQLRVRNPVGDPDNERWAKIIRRPYELTVRGMLTYELAPWWWVSHSVRVCGVVLVDPKTGALVQDPVGNGVCGDDGGGDDDGDDRGGPVDRDSV